MSKRVLVGIIAAIVAGAPAQAGLDVTPVPIDLSGMALKSDIPTPATSMPPGVNVDGAIGSGPQYALANHTHATSVQRAHLQVTAQPITWTFQKPYDPGIEPVVVCTARNVSGATRPYVVNVVGTPTNTSATVVVFQATQPTISILGLSLTLFNSTTSGTTVDCQAAKPTQ